MTVDVLAVGAHPDDADLGVGGTLLVLAARGLRTAILDLTRGELSSRGTVDERTTEAAEAARHLGLADRRQAGLPDGGIENCRTQRDPVIRVLRELRPQVLLAPMAPDRHPDHAAAHALVRDANYFAGVGGLVTGEKPFRAPQVYFYHPYQGAAEDPTFVVDISDHFEQKRTALRAFTSQFHNPTYQGPETWIASEAFWESIETRARYWGGRIGVRYGEPLHAEGPQPLDIAARFGARKETL
jgi:bacillithiol biosynthesis deacetylase BshB1